MMRYWFWDKFNLLVGSNVHELGFFSLLSQHTLWTMSAVKQASHGVVVVGLGLASKLRLEEFQETFNSWRTARVQLKGFVSRYPIFFICLRWKKKLIVCLFTSLFDSFLTPWCRIVQTSCLWVEETGLHLRPYLSLDQSPDWIWIRPHEFIVWAKRRRKTVSSTLFICAINRSQFQNCAKNWFPILIFVTVECLMKLWFWVFCLRKNMYVNFAR